MVPRRDTFFPGALLLVSGFGRAAVTLPPATPVSSTDSDMAATGFYRLSWDIVSTTPTSFKLEEAAHPSFASPRRRYAGPDQAASFSGRSNGVDYYRVRAAAGVWSPVPKVRVAPWIRRPG